MTKEIYKRTCLRLDYSFRRSLYIVMAGNMVASMALKTETDLHPDSQEGEVERGGEKQSTRDWLDLAWAFETSKPLPSRDTPPPNIATPLQTVPHPGD